MDFTTYKTQKDPKPLSAWQVLLQKWEFEEIIIQWERVIEVVIWEDKFRYTVEEDSGILVTIPKKENQKPNPSCFRIPRTKDAIRSSLENSIKWSRQNSHFYINEILSKIGLPYGDDMLRKISSLNREIYLAQWISPYNIIDLDAQLIERNLYDWQKFSLQHFIQSKLEWELYEHFKILFL